MAGHGLGKAAATEIRQGIVDARAHRWQSPYGLSDTCVQTRLSSPHTLYRRAWAHITAKTPHRPPRGIAGVSRPAPPG